MDENGIITMTNTDGTTYTADIGGLIKTYNFVDSDQIDFTATLQVDGSYNVTGTIKGGSITDAMLESGYLASVTEQANIASTSSQNANAKAILAESYAKGGTNTRTGEDTDNAKYYSDRASALVDVDIATTSKAGIVKPDGTTITVDENGLINALGGHTHSNKATLDSITEDDLDNWNAKVDVEDLDGYATLENRQTFTGAKGFSKGAIFYGKDAELLPTDVGSYITLYKDATYGLRILGYNGSAYQPFTIGSLISTGIFSMQFLANGDVLVNGRLRLPSASADPTGSLLAGMIYYNTTDNIVKFYDGTSWKKIGGGTAGETIYDNTESGMTATNVQDAVDELNESLNNGNLQFQVANGKLQWRYDEGV